MGNDYDAIYDGVFDTDAAIGCLARLAGGGPVLEFGVGTGRVAIPLAARSLDVWGIDGSQQMLDRMAAKPGGNEVQVVCGDFADARVDRQFALVLLLVNTIYALPTQDAQVTCFANAARHLVPGGRFVVEAWVPDPPRSNRLEVKARRLAEGFAGLVIEDHDPVRQVLSTTQIVLSGRTQPRVFPVVHRYAWPAELDLMGRLCGMSLEHRWEDWHEREFNSRSTDHISVWRKDDARGQIQS